MSIVVAPSVAYGLSTVPCAPSVCCSCSPLRRLGFLDLADAFLELRDLDRARRVSHEFAEVARPIGVEGFVGEQGASGSLAELIGEHIRPSKRAASAQKDIIRNQHG